jgi:hypothetical protein
MPKSERTVVDSVLLAGDEMDHARLCPNGIRTKLSVSLSRVEAGAAWSPDGRYIAFTDRVDLPGESIDGELSSRGQMFVVTSEGGDPHPVAGRYDFIGLLDWSS